MAKNLTDDQKALNKEARKKRDRAYADRRKAYSDELEAALKPIVEGPLAMERDAADKALDSALNEFREKEQKLKAQIEALKAELQEMEITHSKQKEPLSAARSEAWKKFNAARAAVQETMAEKYSDVSNCYGAAAWKPIEEFLP